MTRIYFNNRNLLLGAAIGLTLVAVVGTAQAAAPTAKQLLSTFNLITLGNVATQSDIEGSAVIGGNLNGASFFNNSSDLPANPSVYLYGADQSSSVNFDNSGNLYYSGSVPSGDHVNFNSGAHPAGHLTATQPNPLSYYTAPLNKLSTTLAALAPTAGTSVANGTFYANGATGLVVFDLTASQLARDLQNSQVQFSGNSKVTGFIVNVTGDMSNPLGNFAEPSGVNFNTPQQDALFNFVDATSVALGNWKTSVLAPDATLTVLNGYLTGSVYAKSFNGGGELHNDNLYNGALPAVAPVPEASTWAMMLAGFGLAGALMRKRTIRAVGWA